MSTNPELIRRAQEYCNRNKLVLGKQLGFGVHGIVFAAKNQAQGGQSAIKIHDGEAGYQRERDAYLRLQEHGITAIRGCTVPELLGYDNGLWVIEMTVVRRPFVLDFAGAYLDEPPDFSEEVIADWRAEKIEQFGTHWSEVEKILRELESIGIYVLDVSPSNISLTD
jgi:hypothetical protein